MLEKSCFGGKFKTWSGLLAMLVDGPTKYRVTFRSWRAHLTGSLWLAFGGLVLWLAALIMFWKYRKRGADTASPPEGINVERGWNYGSPGGLRLQG
jgi:hypothetical protein